MRYVALTEAKSAMEAGEKVCNEVMDARWWAAILC